MSEESAAAPSSEAVAADGDGKKAETTQVLGEILERMGVKATLDVKDIADGSVSIAVMIDGESAGLVAGKRNHVVDSLQFLLNKIINKTPQSRRYINLGIGEHPAPRQQKQPAAKAPAEKSVAAPAPKQPKPPAASQPQKQQRQQSSGSRQQNETTLEVEEDSALTAAARELAEKSAKHGRFVGLLGLTAEDRARVLKAVKEVPGVQAKLEGEGRARRLSLHPDKPTAMPKSMLPDYDDEEDDEEQE